MTFKAIDFLYIFDIIGPTPKLLTFNNDRYKSPFSSVISIIIMIIVISISILLLIQFFNYDSPIIAYSKANDYLVNREINLKDSFFIFQLIDTKQNFPINNAMAYYEAEYIGIYDNGSFIYSPLKVEPCQIGKNLNIKYYNILEEKYKFGRKLEDFYCLSNKENNNLNDINLFYLPNVGYSNIHLKIKVKEGINIPLENIQTLIVSENNIIDHKQKANPIRQGFLHFITLACSSIDYTVVNFNFQYIKYESDEDLFFRSSNISKGIAFSDMSYYRNRMENNNINFNFNNTNNEIGKITLGINQSYYDYYQRSYKKIQSLLAEIMSIVSLIIEIGRIIGIILLEKKMNLDIMNILIKKGKNNIDNIEPKNVNIINKGLSQSMSLNNNNTKNVSKNSHLNLNLNNGNDNYNKTVEKSFKSIGCAKIIKSYFCFKDNNTKFINQCHQIINDDLCVEKILEKFYITETINNYFLNKKHKKIDYIRSNKLKIIEKYIFDNNNETEKEENNINCIKK